MISDNVTRPNGKELTESELRALYTPLVDEALAAFKIDLEYSIQICQKARRIEDRKSR